MRWLHSIAESLGRKLGLLIVTPHASAIGNKAEQVYFALLKARREGRRLVLLGPLDLPWKLRFPIVNREILRIASPYRVAAGNRTLEVLGGLLLTVTYGTVRAFNLFWRRLAKPIPDRYIHPAIGTTELWQPSERISVFSWPVVESLDWSGQLQHPMPIDLRPRALAVADQVRARMGLPADAWFACLHVREGGYHNDHETSSFRNASVENYIRAIRFITEAGGWVVRLGDRSMTRLPELPRVIDYPHTPYKSELMDLYLISRCRYYIGTQSGILDVALLFQRPTLITNMQSWLYPMPPKECDLGILRHVYSRSRGRFLSVSELLDEPWASQHFTDLGSDYVLHENSPDEIEEAVMEMHKSVVTPVSRSPLQNTYNRKRVMRGRAIIEHPIILDDPFSDIHQRYRLASRLGSVRGAICEGFLERNWARSSREQAAPSGVPL